MVLRPTLRLLVLAAAAVLLPSAPARAQGSMLALAPGDPAPALAGWNFDNEFIELPYQGVTLVNFWTTWCQPCRIEMPFLQQLHEALGPQGLRVVGLQREEITAEAARKFVAEVGVSYPVYKIDVDSPWVGVSVFPTSFLVAADGTVLRKYVGTRPEQLTALRRDAEAALAGKPLEALPLPAPAATGEAHSN